MKRARPAVFIVFCFLLLCLSAAGIAYSQVQSSLPAMPLPAHIALGEGEFPIDGNFGVVFNGYKEPRLERAQQRFLDILSRETGIPLWRQAIHNQPHFIVRTAGPSAAVQQLDEDESYHLEISTTDIQLTAANPIGVIRGLQTFLQLVRITPISFTV